MAPYVDAIRRLRVLLAVGIAPMTAAILLSGAETGRAWTLILLLALVLVPMTVVAQHENSVRWTFLRLRGLWASVYRAELAQAALRLVGVGVVVNGEVLDLHRRDYVRSYLREAHRAMADGVPLKGYFLWSFIDNFEWEDGYQRRFGIVHCDFKTQKRTPKLSARYYSDVIQERKIL